MGKFSLGDKAPKQEAINELVLMISNYHGGRYDVLFTHDDGGALLEVQVEVPEVSGDLFEQIPDFPLFDIWPKWMGWRVVVCKVPPGYIDAITHRTDWEDDY
tara:strand:- start:535 stop:840 length:306 start_codon:yes stop_codon:yes gene_type:complete